jgi:hypothetical protein
MLQLTSSNLHLIANSNSEKKLVLVSIEPFDRLNLSTSSGRFILLLLLLKKLKVFMKWQLKQLIN